MGMAVKRPRLEADHTPLSDAEVNNYEPIPQLPHVVGLN
jgi:hypothetical protein